MKVFEIYRPILGYGPEELEAMALDVQKVLKVQGDSTNLHWGSDPRMSSYRAKGVMAEALNERIDDVREVASTGRNGRSTQPNMQLWGFELPASGAPLQQTNLKPRIELAERIGEGGRGSSTNEGLLEVVVEVGRDVVGAAERGAFRGDVRNLERGVVNGLVLVGLDGTKEVITRGRLAAVRRDQKIVVPELVLGPTEVSFCETDDPEDLLRNYGYLSH